MDYQVLILPPARKDFEKLPKHDQARVREALAAFPQSPRPPGCLKLKNSPYWRVRVGDWRIIYRIDDAARTVTVARIRHRREAYR
ncbi:MAG: type II toxin-antitoxin system RelE/ParE family toxin [Chloroflexi bacterium]|nr:type II toxin-antitoxin system RelE/ParE family toxin [Chloroflexota bacterium]